jgi:hypothetical protein
MNASSSKGPLKLLRIATALVVLFALGMTVWLVDTAVLNPDVKAKRPSWVETGAFDVPFWLPLIVTVAGGAACVAYVYVRAARRLREGVDLYGDSYRDRVRRGDTNETPGDNDR